MARVIQEHIKKPLADEVLFGKLKDGGHVRVVVIKADPEDQSSEDKLGFEYIEGPVTPKPETIPPERPKSKRPRGSGTSGGGSGSGGGPPRRTKPPSPRGDGGPSPPSRGSVPKNSAGEGVGAAGRLPGIPCYPLGLPS